MAYSKQTWANGRAGATPITAATLGHIEDGLEAAAAVADAAQPGDADLTTIAALSSATAGALVTDGSGWIRKTYAQLKTALGLVKADVGLGNVDNTTDLAKPISTATQTALDAKLAISAAAGTYAPLTEFEKVKTERGTLLDDFSDLAAWTVGGGGSATLDLSSAGHRPAVRIITASGVGATLERDLTFDGRGKFLSFWIKPLDANFNGALILAAVGQRSQTVARFEGTVIQDASLGGLAGRWKRVTVSLAKLTPAGSSPPAATAVDDIRVFRLTISPKAASVAQVLISDLRLHDNPLPAGIVWQFDDARDDTYTTAAPILEAQGYTGVVAVPTDQIGAASRMTWPQVLELQGRGWGMVSHSKTHADLTSLSLADLQTELRDSYNTLVAQGCDKEEARHFVYPGGTWNTQVLTETLRHYHTARTIISDVHETPVVTDYGLLHCAYITASVALATAKAYIDALAARGDIAIFALHSIVASGATGVNWNAADLTELVAYAKSKGLVSYKMSDLYDKTPDTVGIVDLDGDAFGAPYTGSGGAPVGAAALTTVVNRTIYARVREGGTISQVTFHVGTSAGNISVAAHANSGSGDAAVPGVQLATSGAVACPAAGYAAVSLGSSVRLRKGDWLAISTDSASTTLFSEGNQGGSAIANGWCWLGTGHPAPATPAGLTGWARTPILVGRA